MMKILLHWLLLLIEVRLYQLGSAECGLYTSCTVRSTPLQEQNINALYDNTISTARFTCLPSQSNVLVTEWFFRPSFSALMMIPILPSDSFDNRTIGQLNVRYVNGSNEGIYSCRFTLNGGGQTGIMDTGCLFVHGAPVFEECSGQPGEEDCTKDITALQNGNATFNVRTAIRSGGECFDQNVDLLRLEKGNDVVYTCSDRLMQNGEPCVSDDRVSVNYMPPCEDYTMCKFHIELVLLNVTEADVGMYKATLELNDLPSSHRRTISRTFNLTITPGDITSTANQQTTPITTATLVEGTSSKSSRDVVPPVVGALFFVVFVVVLGCVVAFLVVYYVRKKRITKPTIATDGQTYNNHIHANNDDVNYADVTLRHQHENNRDIDKVSSIFMHDSQIDGLLQEKPNFNSEESKI